MSHDSHDAAYEILSTASAAILVSNWLNPNTVPVWIVNTAWVVGIFTLVVFAVGITAALIWRE